MISCWGVSLPVGDICLNESPFWGKSSCWGFDVSFQMLVLLFGFLSSCRGTFFLTSFLSGVCPSVGSLITCLGFSLPVVSDYRTILSGADLPVGFLMSCLDFQFSCLGFNHPVGEHFSE